MGACLAKVKTIGDDESKNASLESQMPSNGPAPSIAEAEARTPSDITAGRDTDSARPKSPGSKGQTKALKNDGDSKREKGGIFRSRAKLNGKVERPLQAMSSAELVEQYSIDASILMSSVERIDKVKSGPSPHRKHHKAIILICFAHCTWEGCQEWHAWNLGARGQQTHDALLSLGHSFVEAGGRRFPCNCRCWRRDSWAQMSPTCMIVKQPYMQLHW